ncbi:calcium-binding protein [Moorena sp. SIO3I6]|uniref:calcium-binding protein n=1 Tax=Moorena sp. SIO3I6 TaxID=2607831 RepID=UPI0013FB8572|nr:calcium-binding protein [Moorena sp. SIO3I6]NEP27392.1 calcium-binding protein [Moorena sp. SIO3I6]
MPTYYPDNFDNTIYGTSGNDSLYGYGGSDTMYGGSGNDYLSGGFGNDYLSGGSGNDYLSGDIGSDTMYGGSGNDIYVFDDLGDVIVENVNSGIDTVYTNLNYTLGDNLENLILIANVHFGYGNSLNNRIDGNSFHNDLWGKSGNDSLHGNAGNDALRGDLGNDYLNGGSDNDYLFGGYNHDVLIGGSGHDYLKGYEVNGYWERDVLTGGIGADTFVLGNKSSNTIAYSGDGGYGYATITDFNSAQGDKVRLGGSIGGYTMNYSNLGGTSALDTNLYYQNDLIAVFYDNTSFNLANDAIF